MVRGELMWGGVVACGRGGGGKEKAHAWVGSRLCLQQQQWPPRAIGRAVESTPPTRNQRMRSQEATGHAHTRR